MTCMSKVEEAGSMNVGFISGLLMGSFVLSGRMRKSCRSMVCARSSLLNAVRHTTKINKAVCFIFAAKLVKFLDTTWKASLKCVNLLHPKRGPQYRLLTLYVLSTYIFSPCLKDCSLFSVC